MYQGLGPTLPHGAHYTGRHITPGATLPQVQHFPVCQIFTPDYFTSLPYLLLLTKCPCTPNHPLPCTEALPQPYTTYPQLYVAFPPPYFALPQYYAILPQ